MKTGRYSAGLQINISMSKEELDENLGVGEDHRAAQWLVRKKSCGVGRPQDLGLAKSERKGTVLQEVLEVSKQEENLEISSHQCGCQPVDVKVGLR